MNEVAGVAGNVDAVIEGDIGDHDGDEKDEG
jgi:hypothetical protein